MKIEVEVNAPELVIAIHDLAVALTVSSANVTNKLEETSQAPQKDEAKAESPKEEVKEEPKEEVPTEQAISLEEVRAKLTALSESGKQAEAKDLITSAGAKKLTEIPKEKYAELLAKAEKL